MGNAPGGLLARGPFGDLKSGWGNDHLDNHVYDGDGLTVIGLDEAPETYETFAAGWLRRQLQRPVERLDWLRGEQLQESAWRLADSGTTIARKGWSLRRPRHRLAKPESSLIQSIKTVPKRLNRTPASIASRKGAVAPWACHGGCFCCRKEMTTGRGVERYREWHAGDSGDANSRCLASPLPLRLRQGTLLLLQQVLPLTAESTRRAAVPAHTNY